MKERLSNRWKELTLLVTAVLWVLAEGSSSLQSDCTSETHFSGKGDNTIAICLRENDVLVNGKWWDDQILVTGRYVQSQTDKESLTLTTKKEDTCSTTIIYKGQEVGTIVGVPTFSGIRQSGKYLRFAVIENNKILRSVDVDLTTSEIEENVGTPIQNILMFSCEITRVSRDKSYQ